MIAANLLGEAEGVGDCIIESIEEPSSIAQAPFMELSYTGIEPWIVIAVDRSNLNRHIIVVSPEGDIRGHLQVSLEEWESTYLGY